MPSRLTQEQRTKLSSMLDWGAGWLPVNNADLRALLADSEALEAVAAKGRKFNSPWSREVAGIAETALRSTAPEGEEGCAR